METRIRVYKKFDVKIMETFYILVVGQELVSFFSQNTIESLTHVGFKKFHVVHEILLPL